MSEKLIPISRKQHDSYNNLTAGIQAAQSQLQTMANTLLMAIEEDLGQVQVSGVVCRDGVYSLVIDVPEPSAQAHDG